MKDTSKLMSKGIFGMIEDSEPFEPKPFTKKDLEELFDKLTDMEKKKRELLTRMEKAHTKHFVQRAKELGKEPPLWLMLITSPMMNKANGGTFYTSREFLDEHSEWLDGYFL